VLPKLFNGIARYIGSSVYKNGGDIRNVISIGKLVKKEDSHQEISEIMNTMMKYGINTEEEKKEMKTANKIRSESGLEEQ
jgi:hypothetical protein